MDDWPEKSARETRWFDPEEAAELVEEGGLAEIIKGFAGSRVRFVAGENPLGSPREHECWRMAEITPWKATAGTTRLLARPGTDQVMVQCTPATT